MRHFCLDRSSWVAERFYTNESDHDALTTSTTVQRLDTQRQTPRQKSGIRLTCWMGGSVSADYAMRVGFVTINHIASFVPHSHHSPKVLTACNVQILPIQENRLGRKRTRTGRPPATVRASRSKRQRDRSCAIDKIRDPHASSTVTPISHDFYSLPMQ